jgi:hypothetical protein
VVQNMADPPWGGAPGPVKLEVVNAHQLSGTKPLVVSLWPLSVLKDQLLPKAQAEARSGAQARASLTFLQDMISAHERVDVAVGFLLILPTTGSLASTAMAAPRVRYSLPTDALMAMARCA